MNELKHTMRTGSLVRLVGMMPMYYTFITEDRHCNTDSNALDMDNDSVQVSCLDVGLVVDDLIEEEEEFDLLVLFCEKIIRADCRVLRRIK